MVHPPWRIKQLIDRKCRSVFCPRCAELERLQTLPRSKSFWLARMSGPGFPIVRVDRFGCLQNEEDIERWGKSSVKRWHFVWAPTLEAARELLKQGQGTTWVRTRTGCTPSMPSDRSEDTD